MSKLPLDRIRLRVKDRPDRETTSVTEMQFAILPPHLLTAWLLQSNRVAFDRDAAKQFWWHHRDRPWMQGDHDVEPFALWADEAEYTISKEKIFVLLARRFGCA